jgi:hypothetical protein
MVVKTVSKKTVSRVKDSFASESSVNGLSGWQARARTAMADPIIMNFLMSCRFST